MRIARVLDLVLEGLLRVEDGNHGNDRPRPDEFDSSGVCFIRAADMSDGVLNFSTAGRINSVARARIRKGVGAPGDAILSHKGTVGKVAIAPEDSPEFVCSPQTTFWRSLDESVISQAYLRYVLVSADFTRQLDFLKGQTDMAPYVSLTDQRSMTLILPGIQQQHAIAEVLGALDDKIAANNKIACTIEALGSAKLMRVGLDVEPSSEMVLLGEVFDLNPRRTVTSASPTVIDMQALPTAKPLVERWSTGIRKGGARFTNGDTLIARITPCLENRKTAFVDFLKDDDVGIGSTEFIVMRSKNGLPLGLSYFMAISDRFRDFAIQNMVGTSGRQRVSASDLARHTLCPVDLSVLRSFGEWADANLMVLGSLRGENRILATTRDALLPQLMSGKLRVKDAEEIVAATI